MARQEYDENQSIHSMTTRQLRKYIADQADIANKRLTNLDLSETSKAFQDATEAITGSTGKPIRSTSYLSKGEMRELAYSYRDFASLDIYSTYAQSIDWQENRKKYQSFIKNRIEQGDTYWSKYKTPKGNISRKGYEDYKNYIEFLKSVQDISKEYGYKQIKQYARNYSQDSKKSNEITKILTDLYAKNKENKLGWTQSELIDKANKAINDYLEAEHKKEILRTKSADIPTVKAKPRKKKSSTKVQTKTAGKLREYGTVRRTSG